MEQTAQPWAANELLGPSSLPPSILEDMFSVSDAWEASPIQKIYGNHERQMRTLVTPEGLNRGVVVGLSHRTGHPGGFE